MQENKPQETKAWDKDILLERVLHNQEIYLAVLKVFIEEIPQLSKKLKDEILKGNFKDIASIAHNIKGSAFNITANILGAIASYIEKAAKEKNIDEISKLSHLLDEQLRFLLAELNAQI
tara:strand:+ start:578 stop:934 length:357 start_codon:yes stop_codon:yes gene_type:complete